MEGGLFFPLIPVAFFFFFLGQSGDKYPWEWEDGEGKGVQKKEIIQLVSLFFLPFFSSI